MACVLFLVQLGAVGGIGVVGERHITRYDLHFPTIIQTVTMNSRMVRLETRSFTIVEE